MCHGCSFGAVMVECLCAPMVELVRPKSQLAEIWGSNPGKDIFFLCFVLLQETGERECFAICLVKVGEVRECNTVGG